MIIFSLFGILVYISWRFEFKFAVGAIIALIHDVLITVGIFSILNKEISLAIIAALAKLKARRSAPALLKVLQEKGKGKAYLGEFIIPVLGDLGYGEAIGELKAILATDDADSIPGKC